MTDYFDHPAERYLFRSLTDISPMLRHLRVSLVNHFRLGYLPDDLFGTLQEIVFGEIRPHLQSSLSNALVAAWITGAAKPAAAIPRLSAASGKVGSIPAFTAIPGPAHSPPILTAFNARPSGDVPDALDRFPGLRAAIKDLDSRRAVLAPEFKAATAQARQTAFTVARVQTTDAVAKIKKELLKDLESGGTVKDFQVRIADAIQGSTLAPHHTEAIYRTQLAQAYSAGQKKVSENPFVQSAFPYRLWTATHDSRTRPDHLAMEKHGQNGTAVYRADDPMWDTLYPPAGWNCRCHTISLSIRNAARFGSKEAGAWLASGMPPTSPEFAALPYPVKLPKGWPVHDRVAPVVAA